jgi:glycogen debranching enzyme
VVKHHNLYLLCGRDGQVPLAPGHAFGLYYEDCRYLGGYEVRISGSLPRPLGATDGAGPWAILHLALEPTGGGGPQARDGEVGMRWERRIDGDSLHVLDRLAFQNFGATGVELPLSFAFAARFEDVFAIRNLFAQSSVVLANPAWRGSKLWFTQDGVDGVRRSVRISIDPPPVVREGGDAAMMLQLSPGERKDVVVELALRPGDRRGQPSGRSGRPAGCHQEPAGVSVRSDSLVLDRALERSFRDLRLLEGRIDGASYFAAGVPWFATLFGRDSLITALATLPFHPSIAASTLRLLAATQGSVVDDWREERPGKILHELRKGEMARAGVIPHERYYGSVDATPLFLILLARYCTWAGDLALFHELRPNVERALAWIDRYGDVDGDGYLEYQRLSDRGLDNQGWKDSFDGIVNADGTLVEPPVALVEAQAYVYLAKMEISALFERDGGGTRPLQLRREADALRERFNRDFWLEEKGCYALALDGRKRPAAVIASNAGHALWAGIADEDQARAVMERLMAPDMFSGWGIRTLSSLERRYNPSGYHLGSVWPHDNALIAAGFRRYGFSGPLLELFTGLLRAAMEFQQFRLPELFAGFGAADCSVPVLYPMACHPQAWSAASLPSLLLSALGIADDGFGGKIRVVCPQLPPFVSWLEVNGLRGAGGEFDIRFERAGSRVDVEIRERTG